MILDLPQQDHSDILQWSSESRQSQFAWFGM